LQGEATGIFHFTPDVALTANKRSDEGTNCYE